MSKFTKLINKVMTETAAPGFSGTVKAMKKDKAPVDNPWALSWWMKSRHMKSHRKSNGMPKTESVRVEHPTLGLGVARMNSAGTRAEIQWDQLSSWTKNPSSVSITEAERIIVINSGKYLGDKLSEETTMTKIDMTGREYLALMEDGPMLAPNPRNTILTQYSRFKSDAENQPLSGLDGDGGASPEPREEGSTPKDAPRTPKVVSMDEPTRKANVSGSSNTRRSSGATKADSGATKASSGATKSASGTTSGNTTKASSGSTRASSGNSKKPWETDEDKEKTTEAFTLEDADIEGINEMGHLDHAYEDDTDGDDMSDFGGDDMDTDDMGTDDGITVTREFLVKLLQGVVAANLGDEHLETIADAIAECGAGGQALGVDDISTVMDKLQSTVGGDDAGSYDAGEDTGDTDDMGGYQPDDGVDECNDPHGMREGSEESRRRGEAKRKNTKAEKDYRAKGGNEKPKYVKPKAPAKEVDEGEIPAGLKAYQDKNKKGSGKTGSGDTKAEKEPEEVTEARRLAGIKAPVSRKPIKEAWLTSVPNVGNPSSKPSTKGLTEEEIEMQDILRLAGIGVPQRRKF